ncbi:MAG TPA: TetR/AcrR family transcriptional regulator [Syntrophorhabdaceae bacterium]|nr:TetR/AcrR family transcriptional regulator [Syntrophorhabdaceae bacterium]
MNRRSSEETRGIINDAALRVFSRSGYDGASMRMIAGEAGISVGALYLYYRSKEELCSTVFKGLFNEFRDAIAERTREISDPAEQIRAYIGTYMEMARVHREFIYTFNKDKGFAFGVEWKQKFFVELRRFLNGIIRRGIDEGIFADIEESEATKIVLSVLRGYVVSIVIDPDNLFTADACTDILLNGLVKRRGPQKGADVPR